MIHDFQLKATRLRPYIQWFVLSPVQWAAYEPVVALEWEMVPFQEDSLGEIPEGLKGVYTFVVRPSIANHDNCAYLLYVGRTIRQDFKERFRQYLREQSTSKPKRPHITDMLIKWNGYLCFCYAEIEDNEAIVQTEERLQKAYIPPLCRGFPTEIRNAMKVLI